MFNLHHFPEKSAGIAISSRRGRPAFMEAFRVKEEAFRTNFSRAFPFPVCFFFLVNYIQKLAHF
jgi:hypothetical protein